MYMHQNVFFQWLRNSCTLKYSVMPMSRKHISACLRSPLVKTYTGNCISCSNLINFSSLLRCFSYGSIWCTCLCQSSTSILYPAACRVQATVCACQEEGAAALADKPTTSPAIVVPKLVYADKQRVVTSSCGTFSCSRIYPSNKADLCQYIDLTTRNCGEM